MKIKNHLISSLAVTLTASFAATAVPTVTEDYYATNENTVLYIPTSALLDNDSDDDNNNIYVTTVDDTINGTTVYDKSTGLIQFTPGEGFVGSAFFTYAVGYESVNNNDWENTGYATVTIDVGVTEPSNLNVSQDLINELIFEGAEIAALADNFSAQVNTPVTISAQQLIANDYSSANSALYITVVDDAVNGQVAFDQESGSITFTPEENFVGEASFFYGVHHQAGSNDWANMGFSTVTITYEQTLNANIIDTNELYTTELELSYLIELHQVNESTESFLNTYLSGFRFTPSRAIFPEGTTTERGRWVFADGSSVSFATMSEALGVVGYSGGQWRNEIQRNFRQDIDLGGNSFDWTIALNAIGFSQYSINLPEPLENFIQSLTFTRNQVLYANTELQLNTLTPDEQFVLYSLGYFGGWRSNPNSGEEASFDDD